MDYWEKPKSSLRRTQEGGIYSSVLFIEPAASARLHGAEPRVIQLLLLDLRWNRTALNEITDDNLRSQRFEESRGPYEAGLGADAELLGDAQWTWLEKNLQKI